VGGPAHEVDRGGGAVVVGDLCRALGEAEEGGHVGLCGALELNPGVVPLVEVGGGPPVVHLALARDLQRQLKHVGPDGVVHERVSGGSQGVVVGKGAGLQRVKRRDGEGDEVVERVEALSGEQLDAVEAFDDLPNGGVGRRDDRSRGIAVSGCAAGELLDLHVLRAVDADREGRTKRDVLDVIAIGVDLELVIARGVPGTAGRRRAVHPEYRARAVQVTGARKAVCVGDVKRFVLWVVKVVRHDTPTWPG
jgi:hypothetical protein